ncbi:YciI family protein [Streptomyces massasporeus]|uniref:YciI family protein n=1 Tax=Streptomyces massasporeus TaxID=67324 RepID=UPI0033F2F749
MILDTAVCRATEGFRSPKRATDLREQTGLQPLERTPCPVEETVCERMGLLHAPPRDDFIATMTDAERSAFDAHAAWLRGLLAEGVLIMAGPCLGQVNTGIALFEAPDDEAARRVVADEPVTSGGYMRGDLAPAENLIRPGGRRCGGVPETAGT